MRVTMLKDWGFHRQGETVEVWESTGRNWLLNGIAEPPQPASRSIETDNASASPAGVERAERRPHHQRSGRK
jgi:hypothetical protein